MAVAGWRGPWDGAALGAVPGRAWRTHVGHTGLQQLPRLARLRAHPTLPHIPQGAVFVSIFGLGVLCPHTPPVCQPGIVPARKQIPVCTECQGTPGREASPGVSGSEPCSPESHAVTVTPC